MSAQPGVVTIDVFAPKAALPIFVGSVRANEWQLWESDGAAWNYRQVVQSGRYRIGCRVSEAQPKDTICSSIVRTARMAAKGLSRHPSAFVRIS